MTPKPIRAGPAGFRDIDLGGGLVVREPRAIKAEQSRLLRQITTEAQVQSCIIGYLEAEGWKVLPNRVARAHGKLLASREDWRCKGSPDLVCWGHGGAQLNIEVKKPGGKPSRDQLLWLGGLQARGHHAIVAESVEDVKEYMKVNVKVNVNKLWKGAPPYGG